MSRPNEQTRPIYARVTDAIIAELEKGVRPWAKPWSAEHLAGHVTRPLRCTGEPYRGINVMLLWSEAVARGYAAPIWMTFRQALALGGHAARASTAPPSSTPTASNALRRTSTETRRCAAFRS
jgi:antirestriction protein ArdC